jgi:8-oxo-dGTP pyrophosphatase MutT (NUDIX family)
VSGSPPAPPLPGWLRALVALLDGRELLGGPALDVDALLADGARSSAVLVLFGEGADGPDVLLIERSRDLAHHPGQAAFPGGAIEADDDGPAGAALREAVEETGLDPAGVDVAAVLPPLWLSASGNIVTPVIGWWREPSAVAAADPGEVAAVARVPVAGLADPANRCTVRYPSGRSGPAFEVGDLFVWGFTAAILDVLLTAGGWARPWDSAAVREVRP